MSQISQGDGTMAQAVRDGLCPRCQTQMRPIEVHGHTQCAVCHLVIEECCQGETACNTTEEEDTAWAGSIS